MITWQCLPFSELSTQQLYQLIKLRIDVFVVEQTCPYSELDNKDHQQGVHHLLGISNGELVACARLLPAGTTFTAVSIGRVATRLSERGTGLGHVLVSQALKECERIWPQETIEIGAQEHLQHFYSTHGFVSVSERYLEDDIPHVDMTLVK